MALSLLSAFAHILSSQSNSDSDEDYILIEKEEGVAAEAAATAVVEESSVAPHVDIPEQHSPSAQVVSLRPLGGAWCTLK